jgi:hypothetical protein
MLSLREGLRLCLSSFYLFKRTNKKASAESPTRLLADTPNIYSHKPLHYPLKTYCSFAVKSYLYTSQNQALWNTILKR